MTNLPADVVEAVGPELTSALERRGFTSLTPVQEAVLDPELEGRDLQISSQTGSGKTVAIGLAMRELIKLGFERGPRAIVVTPTRELAKQVETELAWLFAPFGVQIVCVTGGSGYRDELRALRRAPVVVVGTPGRLVDHIGRKAFDMSDVGVVALDEADRMLDLGFRDDIEAILGATTEERRTLLVSATFPPEVKALARRVQKDPVSVEGTPLGAANQDIEHVVHLVHPRERFAAIVNLLLASSGSQTLVFARTRADVAELASELSASGFTVGMLSGEMEQPERNRALAAFKRGALDALVATDVAARGIDVADITRVIHAEPPNDPDAYTHRSGRTGRAGKKGTSALLTTPHELVKTLRILSRARVRHTIEPVPSAASIRRAQDDALFDQLTTEVEAPDDRARAIAAKLLATEDVEAVVARLVARSIAGGKAAPRELTTIEPPARQQRIPPAPSSRRALPDGGKERPKYPRPEGRVKREERPRHEGGWVTFRVSWGQIHGADTRRLVAMLCRRGKIDGRDIGAIRVEHTASRVNIADTVAEEFERAASEPDPRDRKVHIRRWVDNHTPRQRYERDERAPGSDPEGEAPSPPRLERDRPPRFDNDRPSPRPRSNEDRPRPPGNGGDRPFRDRPRPKAGGGAGPRPGGGGHGPRPKPSGGDRPLRRPNKRKP